MPLPPTPGLRTECQRMTEVLGVVGDKWTVLVVMALREGPRRFNDLKRAIGGVSQQMLTRTLKALERDGMVSRTVHPTVPPQVEYALTPLGHSLAEPLRALGVWAKGHLEEIDGNRSRYDLGACGRPPVFKAAG